MENMPCVATNTDTKQVHGNCRRWERPELRRIRLLSTQDWASADSTDANTLPFGLVFRELGWMNSLFWILSRQWIGVIEKSVNALLMLLYLTSNRLSQVVDAPKAIETSQQNDYRTQVNNSEGLIRQRSHLIYLVVQTNKTQDLKTRTNLS